MPRIVIIGAGPAGVAAMQTFANKLKPADNVEVVLLEKSKYYYHTIGASRAYTEESFAAKMFVPYDNVVPKKATSFVRFVRAEATAISAEKNEVAYRRINDNEVSSNQSEAIRFDYVIIATGSQYTVPIKQHKEHFSREYTEAKLKEVRDNIAHANSILVVGGGAVGCEVAADIAVHYPNKRVTILEGRSKLVAANDVKEKLRTKLSAALADLKVKVIFGERLEERLAENSFERRTLRTNKGTVIESDIQLLCGGFHPAAELVEAMDASLIDTSGAVKVNDKLQLDHPRYYHIFALGDVVNHKTPKLAYWAAEQAKHVAGGLVAVIRKSQLKVSKPFPEIPVEALILPLGPNGGVSQLPMFGGWVVGDMMTRMFKAKDMGAERVWASLDANVPP